MFPKVYFPNQYFAGQYFEPVIGGGPVVTITQKLIKVGVRNFLTSRTIKVNIGSEGLVTRKDDN